jgi:hypothetical protein
MKRECKDLVDDIDKNVDLLHELSGKSKSDILQMSAKQISDELKKFDFVFTAPKPEQAPIVFKVKGYWFKVNYDLSQLKGKDLIGISEIGKSEESIIMNLHKIVAAYCIPQKRFWVLPTNLTESDKLKIIQHLDVQTAMNISAFFLKLSNRLLRVTKDYFNEMADKKQREAMEILFTSIGDI